MGREQAILAQAADWYARLRDDAAGDIEHQRWRDWLDADPDHANAWRRVQQVLAPFQAAGGTAALSTGTLSRARSVGRRRVLQALGVGGLAVGVGALYRQWPTQEVAATQAAAPPAWRTEIGQQRRLTLPDGTGLALNTASAIDVDFGASLRRIVLHAGEVMVTSAPDTAAPARPLVVDTRHGRITAFSARFGVRGDEHDAQVAAFSGAVSVAPRGGVASGDVAAGHLARFGDHGLAISARIEPWRDSWTRGLLVADDDALGDFIAELRRYTPRGIAVDAAAARLRLVGVYPIATPARDVPAIVAALGHALPVRVAPTPDGGWFIRAA
jgi:transmembrane sensor